MPTDYTRITEAVDAAVATYRATTEPADAREGAAADALLDAVMVPAPPEVHRIHVRSALRRLLLSIKYDRAIEENQMRQRLHQELDIEAVIERLVPRDYATGA